MKQGFAAVVISLGICMAASGQEISREQLQSTGAVETNRALALYRPDVFSTVEGTLLIRNLPALTLLNGRRLPVSTELGRMGWPSLDVVPLAFIDKVEVETEPLPRYGTDAPGGVVNLVTRRFYSGGEVGIFYGRSGGKYGREDFHTYITGGIGNEWFNLTVGAAYTESSGHVPRGSYQYRR